MATQSMQPAYIAGAARIPFAKSGTTYRNISTHELMLASLNHLVDQYGLKGKLLDEVALGAVMNRSTEWPIAREVVLSTGLHPCTPAYFTQRACGTSLDTALQIALKIGAGQVDAGIAAGFDTNSDVPILYPRTFTRKILSLRDAPNLGARVAKALAFGFKDFRPDLPRNAEARTGLSMGEHTELMVKEWQISREEQDQLAFDSHKNLGKAYEEGFFKDLVFEFQGLTRDGILRPGTTLEKLAQLKPVFDRTSGYGTLTAANSSPLTDGSAAVLMCSQKGLADLGLEPWARFVDAQVAAVDFVHGEGLLMAPTVAVPRLLARQGLSLQDFDFYELHEAFTGQVLCTLKAWESEDYCQRRLGLANALGSIDRRKLNIKGSSVATGHPFAATGARIVGSLAKMLKGTQGKRGLISVCTAGGMGVTAILESVS